MSAAHIIDIRMDIWGKNGPKMGGFWGVFAEIWGYMSIPRMEIRAVRTY